MPLTYAIIGTGRPFRTEGATGFGMSHKHVVGFKKADPTLRIVGLADLVEDRAKLFQQEHGGEKIFTDYRQMLDQARPDLVSVCTWPALHTEMVLAAIAAGARAVHCEKPMALTFGEARQMHGAAVAAGCQLTFNHQRRFNIPFQHARKLLRDNTIGTLLRMEVICGNLYDWGTHWFDMIHFLNGESPAEWVMGQIELEGHKEIFGAPLEGAGLAHIKFANNVHATMVTGPAGSLPTQPQFVLHGTEGTLEIEPPNPGNNHLRYRTATAEWTNVPSPEGIHGDDAIDAGCRNVLDCLRAGTEPELSSAHALAATQLIFATYESSRRRGRVNLPLTIDDSPLASMLKMFS